MKTCFIRHIKSSCSCMTYLSWTHSNHNSQRLPSRRRMLPKRPHTMSSHSHENTNYDSRRIQCALCLQQLCQSSPFLVFLEWCHIAHRTLRPPKFHVVVWHVVQTSVATWCLLVLVYTSRCVCVWKFICLCYLFMYIYENVNVYFWCG